MAPWLLLLLVTSVAAEGLNGKAPPEPQPEPTPEPAPEPPSPKPAPTPPEPCAGYACPEYEIISAREGGVQLRRYPAAQWVRFPVPGDDFVFMGVYGTENLEGFFQGQNYEHKVVRQSTPMRIEFDIWNLEKKRWAAYYIANEEQTTVPTPFPPIEIDKHDEIYIYSKQYNATTDFRSVAQSVAETMVDLTLAGAPFDMDNVFLAMYEFPKQGGGERQPDEIWLQRTFSKGYVPTHEVLREAGRNASAVFDMIERRMLN